jgi:hypothetical protein
LRSTAEGPSGSKERESRVNNVFTVLDSKKECLGYYYDGEIKEQKTDEQFITWSYRPHFHDDRIECVEIYAQGKSLTEICPEHLREEWRKLEERRTAFQNALVVSGVDLENVCVFDVIPKWFLKEYSQVKCDIIEWVFYNVEKPSNYQTSVNLEKLFAIIKNSPLNIDLAAMQGDVSSPVIRQNLKKLKMTNNMIGYNQFGSITGRLTLEKNSFPILNLSRSFRKILKPTNDLFVEFDYNAAELRTLLSLLGKEQPDEDIHDWNIQHIFHGLSTRAEAKRRVFAWLYNSQAKDFLLDKVYDRKEAVSKYWDGDCVTTPFGRTLPAQEYYALNYLIQSTTSDLVLEQVLRVQEFIAGMRSKIVFLIHDSFVLDIPAEERYNIPEIKKIFASNRFGNYRVGVRAGKDFGSMKEIDV